MNFAKKQAIYLQIADNICEQILRQQWNVADKIPSVREMAVNVEVNPNTVARTYAYLEQLDIIKMQRGVGYFIAEQAVQKIKELRKQRFFGEELPDVFKTMKLLDISMDDIHNLYEKVSDNEEK